MEPVTILTACFCALVAIGAGASLWNYRKLFGIGLSAIDKAAREDYFRGLQYIRQAKDYFEAKRVQNAVARFRQNWKDADPILLNSWADTLTRAAGDRARALAPKAYRAEVAN